MAKKINYIVAIDQAVGKKISQLRVINNVSSRSLAKLIGVTSQQLSKYERGINRISMGKLFVVTKALGVSIEYFCGNLENTQNFPEYKEKIDNFLEKEKINSFRKPEAIIYSLLKLIKKY